MKATLEFDAPESCIDCVLVSDFSDFLGGCEPILYCPKLNGLVTDWKEDRHPDCELVIEEEGLRWIKVIDDYWNDVCHYECPKCEAAFFLETGSPKENNYNYCPSCGVKLAPPEQDNE